MDVWKTCYLLFDRSRLFSLVIFHETQSTFAFFVSVSISATRSTLRSAVLAITSKLFLLSAQGPGDKPLLDMTSCFEVLLHMFQHCLVLETITNRHCTYSAGRDSERRTQQLRQAVRLVVSTSYNVVYLSAVGLSCLLYCCCTYVQQYTKTAGALP